MFDGNTIGIIAATFLGPIAAVIVTRYVDRLRDGEKRRMEVFRALMRTRRMPLNIDHVGALNLIEIEFHDDDKVMGALRALIDHFHSGYGSNKTIEELEAANTKSDILRTTLLSAMANNLRYKIEQMDIHRGGYTPQGWGVEWDEQTTVRSGLAKILSGRQPLPISVVVPNSHLTHQAPQQGPSPFPPKP